MSDLELARKVISGVRQSPKGRAYMGALMLDYTWYSLDELQRKHDQNLSWSCTRTAELAYEEGLAVARQVLQAQDATYVPQPGEQPLAEYLGLKPGMYVSWYVLTGFNQKPIARQGKITSIDGYGFAFIDVRTKNADGSPGKGWVNMRAPLRKLSRL